MQIHKLLILGLALGGVACEKADDKRRGAALFAEDSGSPYAPTYQPTATGEPFVVADPGSAPKEADNTKVNRRDDSESLTPLDQGNSKLETETTAAIRRGIIADRDSSADAKNIKIITIGQRVTLRGPVNSKEERARIEALALRTSGVAAVDNQLEIAR